MPELLLRAAAIAVASYFCGCFNGAVIVSKYLLRDDVRKYGSGNAGLTNFFRVFGGPLTALVILCDMLKMVAAVLVGIWLTAGWAPAFWEGELAIYGKLWAGLFCLLGHMFPCMFHFKGGKGILSGGTLLLFLDWRVALVGWGGFLLLVLLSRMVSLGSVWAAASFPVTVWFVYGELPLLLLAVVSGGLVVWKHRGNIRRIVSGTESRLTFQRKKE